MFGGFLVGGGGAGQGSAVVVVGDGGLSGKVGWGCEWCASRDERLFAWMGWNVRG